MTPFEQGAQAARAGQGASHNPFPAGSPQNAEWTAGFMSAGGGSEIGQEDNQEGEGI